MNIKNIKDTNSWEFFWLWILGVAIIAGTTYCFHGNKTYHQVVFSECIERGGHIVKDTDGALTDVYFYCEPAEESE